MFVYVHCFAFNNVYACVCVYACAFAGAFFSLVLFFLIANKANRVNGHMIILLFPITYIKFV